MQYYSNFVLQTLISSISDLKNLVSHNKLNYMKTILLSALMAAATLSASAFEINVGNPRTMPEMLTVNEGAGTFKEKYNLDRPQNMQTEFFGKKFQSPRAEAGLSDSELVTDPQGTMSRYAMSVDIFLSNIGATHVGGFGAEVTISDDDKTFFSRAFTLNYYQQGYSAGEIDGDSVVFHSGQYIYDTYEGEKAYMYAAYLGEEEEWPEFVDTFVLKKNEKGQYVSEPGHYFMVLTEEEAEKGINETTDIICFGTNYVFNPLPADLKENTLPADAEIFESLLSTNSLADYGDQVMKDITVGISGDNIYIGGLSDYLPECYFMGTKTSDNTYTFNTRQYIGYHDEGDFPYLYEFNTVNPLIFEDESLYFKEVESIDMTFNDERTLLTIEEGAGVFVCAYGDINVWHDVYWNMLIGDFNQALTPNNPAGVECYATGSTPYMIFEWSNMSVEGIPMNPENLWCEVIVNGETYRFLPEYYEGLQDATDRVYFNTEDVSGLYTGSFTTIYLYEFEDSSDKLKTVGVKFGYQSGDGISYTDIVYAKGFEPFEDKAFEPSAPSNLVYYQYYNSTIRFKFDGKDIEGNVIPERILAVEILVDGEPLVFKDSDYYFNGGEGPDVTMIGLSENANNYNASLVTRFGEEYVLSLWGHEALPEFKTLAIRPVCTGGDTITYGESCEIVLDRAATPGNPWNVAFNEEAKELVFGALPVDTAGNGLAPWSYGYEVYVNDALYEFNGELYDLENNVTFIPYQGFEYNYYFYLHAENIYDETDWSLIDQKVVMSVSMRDENLDIQKIGVRAVYTDGEGNTTYSDIVNSDGTIGTVGIDTVSKDNEEIKWYNLQGVEVANPEVGSVYLRQQGGKTTKVLVK